MANILCIDFGVNETQREATQVDWNIESVELNEGYALHT